jgi:glycosyltransferase involved in cell wall biosynthesis
MAARLEKFDEGPSKGEDRTTRSRILVIGNFLSSQGMYGVCEGLAEKLSAAGYSVLSRSDKPGPLSRLSDVLTTVWRERVNYDVAQVDVYSGRAFLQAEAACRILSFARKPYVLTLHGGNLPNFARKWPRRVRSLLKSAAAVTVPSQYLLEQMRSYSDVLQLVPNPVDVGAYSFRPRVTVQPRLLWLRAFHELYNPSLAPRVLAELANDFPDAQLTMTGPDKGDKSFQRTAEIAQQLSVRDRVKLTGSIPKAEVAAWLSNGDIFLNTTSVDNVPISVLEAMATGLCIVSTNAGGIPYLLEHERDALLVSADNVGEMSAAVRRILTEPELAARLSKSAREKAERYDWKRVLPKWKSLLAGVMQRPG